MLENMNRRIVRRDSWPSVPAAGELDLASLASVRVSSESALFPIDNVFDAQRGPGGSCWVSAEGGAQMVVVAFDEPHQLRSVSVEAEERGSTRTQNVELATSRDEGRTFEAHSTRDFSFSPYGETFREESWTLDDGPITHVRLRITPIAARSNGSDGRPRASLTSVVMR